MAVHSLQTGSAAQVPMLRDRGRRASTRRQTRGASPCRVLDFVGEALDEIPGVHVVAGIELFDIALTREQETNLIERMIELDYRIAGEKKTRHSPLIVEPASNGSPIPGAIYENPPPRRRRAHHPYAHLLGKTGLWNRQ